MGDPKNGKTYKPAQHGKGTYQGDEPKVGLPDVLEEIANLFDKHHKEISALGAMLCLVKERLDTQRAMIGNLNDRIMDLENGTVQMEVHRDKNQRELFTNDNENGE